MTKLGIEGSQVVHGRGGSWVAGVARRYSKWPNHEESVLHTKEFEHLFIKY